LYCPKCGTYNDDNAYKCVKCGTVVQQGAGVPPSQSTVGGGAVTGKSVPTYMVPAILVTLFCCLVGGIVALVYASQVNTKLLIGDYDGAVKASNSAKTWCWVSFAVGLVSTALYFLIMLGNR
jgi:uncharacterized membrane protein YvbJ